MEATPTLRCAIYTRKSNEEGLEQDYNSIDAQKDAGRAYIAAQRSNGWTLVKKDYDDPAYSGGNIDRPALQQLLNDIQQGQIDIVIVYKIDRLSRSINDFGQIMTTFEKHNVSFVSVTQEFNTTTSMGRLMLNILLSFAQFEREVSTERIRDKIAASKRKGLWMGGVPPLGYDVKNRKLLINVNEEKTVQFIFKRFYEIQSITQLTNELQHQGVTTKSWKTKKGQFKQGKLVSKAFLYKLLNNRIYIGEISHHDKWYPGEHQAIINQAQWDNVQSIFKTNRHQRKGHTRSNIHFPLRGILFDKEGYALTSYSTTQKKNNCRYRYYISSKDSKGYAGKSGLSRFRADELEKTVISYLRKFLRSPDVLNAMANQTTELDEAQIAVAMTQVDKIWGTLFPDQQSRIVRLLVEKIIITQDEIELLLLNNGIEKIAMEMKPARINNKPIISNKNLQSKEKSEILLRDSKGRFSLVIPYKVKRRSDKKIIVSPNDTEAKKPAVTPLQLALARGHQWESMLLSGKVGSLKELAEKVGVDNSYVSRMVNLTTLAPDIIKAILDDTLPDTIRLEDMAIGTPVLWNEQRKKLDLIV